MTRLTPSGRAADDTSSAWGSRSGCCVVEVPRTSSCPSPHRTNSQENAPFVRSPFREGVLASRVASPASHRADSAWASVEAALRRLRTQVLVGLASSRANSFPLRELASRTSSERAKILYSMGLRELAYRPVSAMISCAKLTIRKPRTLQRTHPESLAYIQQFLLDLVLLGTKPFRRE